MREFIALLRECLSGAKVTFAGDYYQVRGFRLGVELDGCRSPPRPAAVLLPKTSSMLVGGDVRVGPILFAIAIGGALVRRGTLWHGDRPCCCDWPISV
jgi:hypothetical protein